jgi:hypothetical protein
VVPWATSIAAAVRASSPNTLVLLPGSPLLQKVVRNTGNSLEEAGSAAAKRSDDPLMAADTDLRNKFPPGDAQARAAILAIQTNRVKTTPNQPVVELSSRSLPA